MLELQEIMNPPKLVNSVVTHQALLEKLAKIASEGSSTSIIDTEVAPLFEELGKKISDGKIIEAEDQKELVRLCRLYAEKGYAPAQNNLGACYENGIGVEKDAKEAVGWYHLAAEQGFADAQYHLGRCCLFGKEPELAVKWFRLAAGLGHAGAQYKLGCYYESGPGVTKDAKEAVRLYSLAANQGHADAQFNLGCHYRKRWHVTKDDKDYEEYLKCHRLAAEQGHADAQNNLGCNYTRESFSARHKGKEAVKWYRLAAAQGHALAQTNLGYCYDNGFAGCVKDRKEALKWFNLAAKQGFSNAQGAVGIRSSDVETRKYWIDLAAKSEANEWGRYEDGWEGEMRSPAITFGEAAREGYEAAINAMRLKEFEEIAKTTLEPKAKSAVEKYRTRAEGKNDKEAQFSLGFCYENGIGVEKDTKEALRWYRASAAQGNAEAQYHLGYCHEKGIGVQTNPKVALGWYTKAAAGGDDYARKKLQSAEFVELLKELGKSATSSSRFLGGSTQKPELKQGVNELTPLLPKVSNSNQKVNQKF